MAKVAEVVHMMAMVDQVAAAADITEAVPAAGMPEGIAAEAVQDLCRREGQPRRVRALSRQT